MKYLHFTLFYLLFMTGSMYAQEQPVILEIRDADTKEILNATVFNSIDAAIAITDSNGKCIIPQKLLKKPDDLYIKSQGHKHFFMNTTGLTSMIVFMQPAVIKMKEAVITARNNNQPQRILKAYTESVVDFNVSADGIALATWGRKIGQ